VYPKLVSQPQTSKTESGTYGVTKTVRHLVENPGKVRRLTAAIVVNDRLIQEAGKGAAARWQGRSQDELRNLTALAQAAVGFDASRGDVVTVQDLAFEENRTQPAPSVLAQMMSKVEASPLLVKYLSLLVGLMAVLAFGVRPALRKALSEAKSAPRELAGAGGAGRSALPQPEVAIPDPDHARAQEIFQQVTSQLKQDPAQSSRLLQSWIHSE
jgi:flagellar M-ring protein FliF